MSSSHSPLEQFVIKPIREINIAGYDVSLTNSSLTMLIVIGLVSIFLIGGVRRNAVVPGRWQSMVEVAYEFIAGLVKENVGSEGKKYFPFIFTLFMFILGSNLWGLLPYQFTVTSHIIVTFAVAIVVFSGITLIGFIKHGFGFLRLFLPPGVPWWLWWFIIPIEMISYLTRPVSLSVRLFANMFAGHMMMKIFAGFVITLGGLGTIGYIGAVLPLGVTVALTGLEMLVAFLQAYVFTVLTCIYLNDAMHPSH